jgi:hypothetical protein
MREQGLQHVMACPKAWNEYKHKNKKESSTSQICGMKFVGEIRYAARFNNYETTAINNSNQQQQRQP